MGTPSTSLATLRPELAGSFMEFDLAMDRRGFIANQVLPVMEVALASGDFGKIPIEELLQKRTTLRGSSGDYARGHWNFTKDSFATEEHGAEEPVDERDAKLYAEYIDAEMISSERAIDIVLRNFEQRVSDLIFNATTWTGASLTTGITNEWDDVTNAVPITDVEAAVQKVYDNSGLWPNALIINRKVFRNLRLVDQITARIAATGAGDRIRASDITMKQLAEVFDLQHIIVAGGSKNTADEGQSATLSPLWSDEYAMVCKIAEGQDIKEPCIGRAFHWGEDGSNIGGAVESYRDEAVRADIMRARMETDEKVLYTEMGHLLSNITT